MPQLCNLLFHREFEINMAALSVLEEACFDGVSFDFLLEEAPIQHLIRIHCEKVQFASKPRTENSELEFKSKVRSISMEFLFSTELEMFITKFLRSEKGFKIL
jgi:hypothetical protein